MFPRFARSGIFLGRGVLPSAVFVQDAIPLVKDLESRSLQGVETMGHGGDVGQSVPFLDLFLDSDVLGIGRVVTVGEAPFVAGEDGAGFEDAVDFGVTFEAVGGVAGGFDGVGGVEGGGGEGLGHEVSLDGTAEEFWFLLVAAMHDKMRIRATQLVPPVDLILIQRQPRHVTPREFANVPHRPSDAAAHVQNPDVRHGQLLPLASSAPQPAQRPRQIQHPRQVKLVPPRRLVEALAGPAIRKVEAAAPAPLVEQRGQIVVGVDELGVLGVAGLDGRGGRLEGFVGLDGGGDGGAGGQFGGGGTGGGAIGGAAARRRRRSRRRRTLLRAKLLQEPQRFADGIGGREELHEQQGGQGGGAAVHDELVQRRRRRRGRVVAATAHGGQLEHCYFAVVVEVKVKVKKE
mmetsp:Transcript_23156/g.48916  ORF Transcript_23156/g.48916 Transcript_23156/m.48916 type:complete len:403 (-) Transcript_23156:108-1316(-)